MLSLNWGKLSSSDFLYEYWQKKPLLLRQALPHFSSPISADELAGLACETGVESRLVLEKGGQRPWEVRHGPFAEADFTELPATHWSLLVQEVNRYVPELAALMDLFNFVPQWRLDDVMMSYAPPQGSVGAHVDSYDVFLIQAHGSRLWQISQQTGDFIPELDLRVLKQFKVEHSWVLDPGDILYLPPGIAHHGVAVDDCLTISVGFLAPTQHEILNHYVQHIAASELNDQRYSDPELPAQTESGEIDALALQQIQHMIQSLPMDAHSINQWFGRFITESRSDFYYVHPEPAYTQASWLTTYEASGCLRRVARAAFIHQHDEMTLFIEGQALPLSPNLAFIAPLLSQRHDFPYALFEGLLNEDAVRLMVYLTNQGYLYFD